MNLDFMSFFTAGIKNDDFTEKKKINSGPFEKHIKIIIMAQRPRIDLNKRFLPRPNTTTA